MPFATLILSPFFARFTAAWILRNLQPRLQTRSVLPLPDGGGVTAPGFAGSG